MSAEKKQKTTDNTPPEELPAVPPSDVEFVKVLENRRTEKELRLLGRHRKTGSDAVMILRRHGFEDDAVDDELKLLSGIKEIHHNSRFSKHQGTSPSQVTVEVVCPAKKKDILKYSPQVWYMMRETPAIYQAITKPMVDSIPESDIQWVYNVLDGKKEQDTVLMKNEDFMCAVDYKWQDQSNVKGLHLLCMVMERGTLRSVRDLEGSKHLNMLKTMRNLTLIEIQKRYHIPSSQVLSYFHYYPSFWHVHVHFTHVSGPSPGDTRAVGKAILLDDVIDNLTADPNYYQKATITLRLSSVKHRDVLEEAVKRKALSLTT